MTETRSIRPELKPKGTPYNEWNSHAILINFNPFAVMISFRITIISVSSRTCNSITY